MSESEKAVAFAEPEDDVLVAELEGEDCDTAPVPEDAPDGEASAGEAALVAESASDAPERAAPTEAAEAAMQAAREESDGVEAAFDRYAYLEPFIEPIGAALELTEVEDDEDLVMRFAGEAVSVSAWARGVALDVIGSVEARETSAYRIVEGLALEAKIKEDLARVAIFRKALDPDSDGETPSDADAEREETASEPPPPRPPDHLRAELIHDVALGRALMSELQRVIDSAVVNGNMELAKSLTSFKPSLNHAVNDARELLLPEDLGEAQAQSETLVRVPCDAELPEIRRRRRRRRRRMQFTEDELAGSVVKEGRVARSHSPRRVRIMATLLVASILTWLALLAPRFLEEQQRVFTINDFAGLPGVEKVVARPPSLFVTLDGATWAKLKQRERRDLVDEIAFSLSRAGYTGARFATPDGQTVAQWLKTRGVELKGPAAKGPTSEAP